MGWSFFHEDGLTMGYPFSKRATNQPLVALLHELDPIVSSMLMFTQKVGNEDKDSLLGDMKVLRGYVLEIGKLLNKYDMLSKQGSVLPRLIRLANRLDTMGAQAMADILDETAFQLIRNAQQAPQQQLAQQQQLADKLLNIHTEMLNATRSFSNPTTIPAGMKRLLDQVRELGLAVNMLKQSLVTPTTIPPTTAGAVQELIQLADSLDIRGRHILADVADRAAGIVNKLDKEEDLPIKPGHRTSLSTRYCPDHIGVQAARIAERVYQCPIDGRTYDYDGGYTDYNGQRIPGGSIAAQTPMTAPYALPQRLFDSRQNVMNTIN